MSSELVPGDIYLPQGEVMCDSLILQGEVFVNEANLTGESIPIAKFATTSILSTFESYTWLNEGSQILESSEKVRAIVINTGFTTKRGRIIRHIQTRKYDSLQIYRTALIFVCESALVSCVAFGLYVGLANSYGIEISEVFRLIMFFDILSVFVPAFLPIFFNMNYSYSLARLRFQDILGTTTEKTVDSALLKVMCFDKTGTLTEEKMEIEKLLCVENDKINHNNLKESVFEEKEKYKKILNLLSTCHLVRKIEDKLLGDPIDCEIFRFSRCKFKEKSSIQAIA